MDLEYLPEVMSRHRLNSQSNALTNPQCGDQELFPAKDDQKEADVEVEGEELMSVSCALLVACIKET